MYRNIFHIFFVAIFLSVVGEHGMSNSELYEGSKCYLENGEFGTCKKVVDCPTKLEEVKEGKRIGSSVEDRCGFNDFTEIVCCAAEINQRRKADLACEFYRSLALDVTDPTPPTTVPNMRSSTYPNPVAVVHHGVDALDAEFPFMVALGYRNKNETVTFYDCGGSLISMQHVLTASHCVSNIHGKVPVEVLLGTTDIANISRHAQRIEISNIIKHPDYRRAKSYNDVAILKLHRKIQLTFAVNPGCLYTKPLIEVNKDFNFVVLGWGDTDFGSNKPSKLQKSPHLGMVSREECSKHYVKFLKLPFGITDTLLCTIDRDQFRRGDACTGDSGGPLVLSTSIWNTYVNIAGISAFGSQCGSYAPGVSTLVYPFLDWIEEIVWPNNTW